MKNILAGVIAAVLLAGCGGADSGTVKMITDATFPPYEYLRGQEVVGIDVEICRAIAQKLGKEFKVGNIDFDSVIPAKNFVKGEADLALSDFEYAIAIRKGQPKLLVAINETIAEIKSDGRLAKWIDAFTSESDRQKAQ